MRHFKSPVKAAEGESFAVGDHVFIRRADLEPPFVLVPHCSRCHQDDPEQFRFEPDLVNGIKISRQAHSWCLDCRFTASVVPADSRPATGRPAV